MDKPDPAGFLDSQSGHAPENPYDPTAVKRTVLKSAQHSWLKSTTRIKLAILDTHFKTGQIALP